MKKLVWFLFAMLIIIGMVYGHGEDEFDEAKQLIKDKVLCAELTEEQLEMIGDYYMEQMHPGEAHEAMDKMMGGEGSESLKQTHIAMARRLYCNEDADGMMNMMNSRMMGYGRMIPMTGSLGYGFGYWNFINILYAVLLIGITILVYFWIIKLRKETKKR